MSLIHTGLPNDAPAPAAFPASGIRRRCRVCGIASTAVRWRRVLGRPDALDDRCARWQAAYVWLLWRERVARGTA